MAQEDATTREVTASEAGLTTTRFATPVEVDIPRPDPGRVAIIDVPPGAKVNFGFALGDCKVLILDLDVVLVFPDGAKLVLPQFAINIVSPEPPQTHFLTVATDPQVMLSSSSETRLAEPLPSLTISEEVAAVNDAQRSGPVVQMPTVRAFDDAGAPPLRTAATGRMAKRSGRRWAASGKEPISIRMMRARPRPPRPRPEFRSRNRISTCRS